MQFCFVKGHSAFFDRMLRVKLELWLPYRNLRLHFTHSIEQALLAQPHKTRKNKSKGVATETIVWLYAINEHSVKRQSQPSSLSTFDYLTNDLSRPTENKKIIKCTDECYKADTLPYLFHVIQKTNTRTPSHMSNKHGPLHSKQPVQQTFYRTVHLPSFFASPTSLAGRNNEQVFETDEPFP